MLYDIWQLYRNFFCATDFQTIMLIPGRTLHLPRLYAILDASRFSNAAEMVHAAQELASAGVTLIQYRNKSGTARQVLEHARALKQSLDVAVTLIMNDRADVCLAADFAGLHIGQDDISSGAARSIIGPDRWLGISTHNPEQIAAADQAAADYLAIGPVFSTPSKENPDPVVGLEGVRRARKLTRKPLVAIGGISLATARSVIDAGADSIAVISGLSLDPRKSAEAFFEVLR